MGAISLLVDLLHPLCGAMAGRYAKQLIEHFNSMDAIFTATPEALRRPLDGNEQALAAIVALRRIDQLRVKERIVGARVCASHPDLHKYLVAKLDNRREERLRLIFLDRNDKLLRDEGLTSGAKNHILCSSRLIISRALDLNADKLILAHNHTSGHLAPSEDDRRFTAALESICTCMDIELVDHLIVGCGNVFSMREGRAF